ncbi:ATP-binding cassette domain-containing protein [Fusobacterium hominis]|uniref:ATP-binding cassette domain-containing protein n=1 Tax=Fusobacterium hominis TaxID=2764326 RepID=A0A7G9GW37_9FUSO|nr:ATP-binding cassette domain-containing protein [Fusobacterium hominis]QNM15019.1 ATP-binding cassette domain-containing protein [Fusobacterium hominis]
MKLIEIENLNLEIDGEKLLKNINLSIESGEIVALAGESGSGKTLTTKFILGILPERSIVKYDKFEKPCKIGAVFQNAFTSLNPTVKIGSQLKKIYEGHYGKSKEWKERVLHILKKVGIKDSEIVLSKYPFETSGGEKQRIVIAGALIGNPQLLIADEVTTALDLKTKKEVIDLFKNIQAKTGISILFISHDLDAIRGFANRVYVTYKGEIVEENSCEEIFKHQTHPYVQKLMGLSQKLWVRGE